MREWVTALIRGRLLDLALALALGTALAALAERVAAVPISVLAQNFGRNPYSEGGTLAGLSDLFSAPFYLNFSVGRTVIVYGQVLSGLLTLGLIALVTLPVVRRRQRELGVCSFCASRVPFESTHCAYCGSGLAPGEP